MTPSRSLRALVLLGLAVSLLVGMSLSYFADPNPDGLEASFMEAECADAADPEACLEDAAGDPVFTAAPLPDYEIGWLSGLVGVVACFAVAGGLVLLARRTRAERAETTPPR